MTKTINILITLAILSLNGACQKTVDKKVNQSNKVDLKWKIEDDKILAYKTIMEQVDIGEIEMPSQTLFDKILKSDPGNIDKYYDQIKKFFESFYEGFENYSIITVLEKREDNNIDVKMVYGDFSEKQNTDEPDAADEKSLFKNIMKGVQLRGIINENGGIESFYTKRDQKNLLAAFFQLPEHSINIGDKWELEINWLTTDHYFICQKADRINEVQLIDVVKRDGETIGILKYEIYEKVDGNFKSPLGKGPTPTMMEMRLEGICEFSITAGKWKNYSGLLSFKSTGYQNVSYKQKYALIELEVIPEKVYDYIEK